MKGRNNTPLFLSIIMANVSVLFLIIKLQECDIHHIKTQMIHTTSHPSNFNNESSS